MQTFRSFAYAVALIGSVAIAGCTTSDPVDATLRVQNSSSITIEQLYLTQIDNSDWGPNRLGNDVLFPGESITLGVDCDTYDARLVDEAGDECTLDAIDLCLNDADWVIRDNTCNFISTVARSETQKKPATSASATAKHSLTKL